MIGEPRGWIVNARVFLLAANPHDVMNVHTGGQSSARRDCQEFIDN